ncbi:MAG: tetraacyldisaccharide 4'-kinase [Deltaproteobacteria bacterium]|nr:tetraacyldisaccharide 4'-kinase [Deltaproteobacteria bacterium]MBW2082385.1 tetraacyldisaccharide 4'-kinase [Deltaproteobacteria bacterium]
MEINWEKAQKNLSRFPFSAFMLTFSLLYGLGARARWVAYSRGILRQRKLPGFVLSVGNITVGGTGKTPMTIMLASWAKDQGFSVCVLSRGYGGSYKGDVLVVSDGEEIKASWEQCGDEPYLIASEISGVPVVVARKRFLGGRYAHEKFGSNLFILDDGFQHLALKRDIDLLLIDSLDPFGGGQLLPLGKLREPLSAIKRANLIVFSNFSSDLRTLTLLRAAKEKFPDRNIFEARHVPTEIILSGNKDRVRPEWINGKRVAAFAGIANSENFERTLSELGAKIGYFRRFSDHHVYSQDDIRSLIRAAKRGHIGYILTTQKDWVKMERFIQGEDLRFGYVRIRFDLLERERDFFETIKSLLSK